MDLRFSDAEPTAQERVAVDAVLGPPDSSWVGAVERPAADTRVARAGRDVRARRDELLPAFDAVQSAVGWISEGALMYICRRLLVPPAEAYGVATFYALLSTGPQPPRVVHVCDDVGCRGFGADDLIARLEADFGPEARAVGDAQWLRSPCLGQCDRAPACYAQLAGVDDGVVVSATYEAVAPVLAGAPAPPPPVVVPQAGDPDLRLLRRVGVVDPGDLDAYRAAGGYDALRRAVAIGPAGVLREVSDANLRGRGGAAFPASVKWEAVAAAPDRPRYLICNADESEPGTFKDRVIMEGDPFAIVEAMTIAGFAIGAELGYLYVRGEYPLATGRVVDAIAQARRRGLLGGDVMGARFAFDIELRRGQGAYICGEETALMNSIEGYRGEPRNKPPFPTQAGLFGRPTVINNVETLINVPAIVAGGGPSYARTGTADSTGTRLFCLSGAVARPGVYEVASGTTLGALIDLAGGATDGIQAILLGGAAGSFVTADRLDLPLTFEDARAAGVALGSGVVMVFGEHNDVPAAARRIARFFRDESCGQCVPCRVGTVRVEEALDRYLSDGRDRAELDLIAEIDQVMKDASICGLGHTAGTAIRSALDQGLLEGGR
ncbi:MAG TPA: NADH-ubiquinone oxidoreductase-F iron-sulfur binding region domain-containing protein [Euzebyales bacterium]|nr:NADH-ubiquinone oxidoreductase-F iron-sulfur binding region domain-containing protein [Euzebyales bacterium]